MDFEDDEERRQKVAMAATERRDVWMSVVVASIGTGRHPQEACDAGDLVLASFDAKFPGLMATIASCEERDNEDEA